MDRETELTSSDKEKIKEKTVSPAVKELTKKLEAIPSMEEKIRSYLAFMKGVLEEKTPRFKDYWDAKHACLPLFKEPLAVLDRSQLWHDYTELSAQARQLKVFLDEESAFAVEQIDLAIQALETDLGRLSELLEQVVDIQIPEGAQLPMEKKELYASLQRELYLLNVLATRVTSLRKEIIKTEMRIRIKNKLFDRLSHAGDQIFPKRKELIHQISTEFLKDVMRFSETHFSENSFSHQSIFDLRNGIKALQMMAKELTLDTQTFNKMRFELSRCWDLLKEKDQEWKKELSERREANQKNVLLVMDKIKPFAERCLVETFTDEEASKQTKEILTFMKTIELGRDEIHYLKEQLAKARSPIQERLAKHQEAREKKVEEMERQQREKIEQFKHRIKEVMEKVSETPMEELAAVKERLQQECNLLPLSHAERELLEHELKMLRDAIIDKKEKAISQLSSEQKESLDHLYQALEEWEGQRNEIQSELKTYRKAVASSGFDFEKAIRYRELIDSEQDRLDKVNATIEKLENQIDKLESAL